MTAGRYLSIGSVVAVGVLGAAFAAWSGLTGPTIAGVQLTAASENTAASSFMATVDATESVIGTDEVITVLDMNVREVPDRATVVREGEVTGVAQDRSYRLTLTQVGDSCWTTVEPPGTKPLECEMSRVHVMSLPAADTTSGVTVEDGTYSLDPVACRRFISAEVSDSIGMCSVGFRISGSYISWERISFYEAISGANIQVVETIRFSHYGDVPEITTPAGPPTATASSSGS